MPHARHNMQFGVDDRAGDRHSTRLAYQPIAIAVNDQRRRGYAPAVATQIAAAEQRGKLPLHAFGIHAPLQQPIHQCIQLRLLRRIKPGTERAQEGLHSLVALLQRQIGRRPAHQQPQ